MKIAIDAGHGLHTPGKRCLKSLDPNQTREWVLNDRMVRIVTAHLERCGVECLRLDDPSGNTDVSLKTRSAKANAAKADYCVSIHHNAGISGGNGGGAVVYVYSGKHAPKADKLQTNVYEGLVAAVGRYGNRSRPLAAQDLHMVRQTHMPAILVEVGFMDSATDVPLILDESWAAKAAEGIARGIVKTAGIDWVEEFVPYLARVTTDSLNVRSGAGIDHDVAGSLVKGEVVYIIQEKRNGITPWGRLNLGLGWISLGYTARV